METQARQTDRAIARLGATTSLVGGRGHQRQVNDYEQSLRRVEQRTERLHRGFKVLEGDLNSVGRLLSFIRTPALIAGIGLLVQTVGALAGGAISLVPQLGQLGGGLVSLLPRVADLTGAMAPLLVGFGAMGLAAGTLKFALGDLKQAWAGNAQAIMRLTPQAYQFLQTLRSYRPVMQAIRREAQQGIFAGLEPALQRMRVALPVVRSLIADMSQRLGGLAQQASLRVTTPQALQDILGLGQQAGRVTTRGGQSLLNVADALRNVAVAAEPLTEWISRVVLVWSRMLAAWTQTARESGILADHFARTRRAIQELVAIGRDAYVVLRDLGRAARGTGDSLWAQIRRSADALRQWAESVRGQRQLIQFFDRARTATVTFARTIWNLTGFLSGLFRASNALGRSLTTTFEQATARWNRWANSFGGQMRLTRMFHDMQPALQQILGLITDIARMVVQMGTGGGLANVVAQLREAVPMVARILTNIARDFGPPILHLLLQIGQLLETLTGVTGPVVIFVHLLANILGIVNSLIQRIPHFGQVLTSVLMTFAVVRFTSAVARLAREWFGVAEGANAAAAAEERALVGGGAAGAAGAGAPAFLGRGLGRGMMETPIMGYGLSGGATATTGLAGVYARAGGLGARASGALARVRGIGAPGLLGGAALLGTGALALAPGVPRPVASTAMGALQGAMMGMMVGNIVPGIGPIAGAVIGGGVGLGTGLWGAFSHRGQASADRYLDPQHGFMAQMQDVLRRTGGMYPQTMRQLREQVALLQTNLQIQERTQDSTKEMRDARQQVVRSLQDEIAQRRTVLTQEQQQERIEARIRAQQRLTSDMQRARRSVYQLGGAYDVFAQHLGPETALQRTLGRAEQIMPTLGPQARRWFADQLLAWSREWDQAYPRFGGQAQAQVTRMIARQFSDLHANVTTWNGRIVEGTLRDWRRVSSAMANETERAREAVSRNFTAIQQQAVAVLRAMGFSDAAGIVRMIEAGHAPAGGQVTTGSVAAAQQNPSRNPLGDFPGTAPGLGTGRRAATTASDQPWVFSPGDLHGRAPRTGGPDMYHGHPGDIQPGIRSVGNRLLAQFPGLSVTSTTDGGSHSAQSYHYRGMALDLAGSEGEMRAAAQWLARSYGPQIAELIHNPGSSIKNGRSVPPAFWGARTWAGHRDHIHLAIAGTAPLPGLATLPMVPGSTAGAITQLPNATPGGLPSIAQLLTPSVGTATATLGGVNALMAGATSQMYSVALTNQINAALLGAAATGGAAGALAAGGMRTSTPVGGGRGGGPAANMRLGYTMMLARGLPASEWPALKALWTGESGWNANAVNPTSGAAGIPQALGHGHVFALGDASAQIGWGLDYIMQRYGTPSRALSFWQGHSPHWYGGGVDMHVSRPTLIGVGESGIEHVQVTPVGGGDRAGGTRPVRIGQIIVHNHRPGDVREQVVREVRQAFDDLAGVVDLQGVTDAQELLR